MLSCSLSWAWNERKTKVCFYLLISVNEAASRSRMDSLKNRRKLQAQTYFTERTEVSGIGILAGIHCIHIWYKIKRVITCKSFKDCIADECIIPVKRLFVVRDEFLFLSKSREAVVHIQLPSGRQLQSTVVRRGPRYVDVVLVVWRLWLGLGVLGSPRVVGNHSLL